MAAPKDSPEQAFRLRRFQGTNTEIDSTFLGPSYVAASENWIPAQSFRLAKRPGTTLVQSFSADVLSITDLLACRDATHLYLYTYFRRATDAGVYVSIDEQPITWPNITFPTPTALGRMIQFRNRIYAGNGVDPLQSWPIGNTDPAQIQIYGPITSLGAPPAPTPATAPAGNDAIPTGTYSYAWAAFDKDTGRYSGRTASAQVVVPVQTTLTFAAPSAAFPPATGPLGFVYRLFVSPRNFPIEYATLNADNLAVSAVTASFSSFDVSDTRVPLAGGTNVFRTGNMFVVWRNRVVFAGMASDPYSVFATDTILPGLEQSVFNQGTMFPVNAKVPLPARVTGVGIAGTTTDMDAQAPLLFFTMAKTFIVNGDPFSTTEPATMQEISSRIGCVAHDSIVNTPVGTIFMGLDSVYLIPPGGGYPQDIGWPIADQIRGIAPGLRSTCVAYFHKQFYKLAIPNPGGSLNTRSWWLDLRAGIGDTPSWWGPMTAATRITPVMILALSCCATDPSSATEIDRGYAIIPGTPGPVLVRTHQLGTYTDYATGHDPIPITSVLRSGRFDADQPFIVKVFTRLRLIAQTAAKSSIQVSVVTDGGVTWQIDPIKLGEDMTDPGQFVHLVPTTPFPGPSHPPPNRAWRTAQFGTVSPVEAQTIAPYTRPRGLSAVVTLTHGPVTDPQNPSATQRIANVELRDFEFLFLFSERKVRYTGFSVSGGSGPNRVVPPERISK